MPAFDVKVSTVSVSISPGSLNITEVLKQRATASFIVPDEAMAFTFEPGEPVEILDESLNVIFGGTIDQAESWVRSGTDQRFWSIKCNDYTQIAERRSAFFSFTYENDTADDIVTALVTAGLTSESVGMSLQPGPVIASFQVQYEYVAELLNRVCKLAAETTGYAWQWTITFAKVLRFFYPGFYTAPFTVTAAKCHVDTIRVRETREDYFNRVVVRIVSGGSVTTVFAENTAEQTARAAIEGGSGVYEKIISVSDKTTAEAQAIADAEMAARTSSPISRVITFDTDEVGLEIGQQMTVDIEGYGTVSSPAYSVDYLIRRKTTRDIQGLVLRRSIEGIKGPVTKDYVEYFQGLRGETPGALPTGVTKESHVLTANDTITTATTPTENAILIKIIEQDGTGGWTITWDSALFDAMTGIDIRLEPGKRTAFIFTKKDTKWFPISIPLLEE